MKKHLIVIDKKNDKVLIDKYIDRTLYRKILKLIAEYEAKTSNDN